MEDQQQRGERKTLMERSVILKEGDAILREMWRHLVYPIIEALGIQVSRARQVALTQKLTYMCRKAGTTADSDCIGVRQAYLLSSHCMRPARQSASENLAQIMSYPRTRQQSPRSSMQGAALRRELRSITARSLLQSLRHRVCPSSQRPLKK